MQARTRPQAAAEGRDDDDGAVRGVALLVVTDGGGWRWDRARGSAPLSLRDGATREEGIGREARVQEGEIEGKRDDGARERALRCGLGLEQRGGWA